MLIPVFNHCRAHLINDFAGQENNQSNYLEFFWDLPTAHLVISTSITMRGHFNNCQHPAETLNSSSKQKLELDTKFTVSYSPPNTLSLTQTLNTADTLNSSSKQKLEFRQRFEIRDLRLEIRDLRFEI